MLFNKKDFDSKQRFSIRKLSVGVCSVLLSTLFLTFNEGQTVHASTDVNAADATTTSVSSNTTNNSSDNNTDKKDGTLPDSMKNHSDHSSIRHMGSHEKPVCLLLLSTFPVHLHIF